MGPLNYDYNNQLIILTMITLEDSYCIFLAFRQSSFVFLFLPILTGLLFFYTLSHFDDLRFELDISDWRERAIPPIKGKEDLSTQKKFKICLRKSCSYNIGEIDPRTNFTNMLPTTFLNMNILINFSQLTDCVCIFLGKSCP